MKKLILSCLLLSIGWMLQAQDTGHTGKAATKTAELTELYQLDDQQTANMLAIQSRKYAQIEEVAGLETSDYPLFVRKMNAIRKGANFSIEKMLNKEQRDIFQQQTIERRKAVAELARTMKAQGASPQEIEKAQLRLE